MAKAVIVASDARGRDLHGFVAYDHDANQKYKMQRSGAGIDTTLNRFGYDSSTVIARFSTRQVKDRLAFFRKPNKLVTLAASNIISEARVELLDIVVRYVGEKGYSEIEEVADQTQAI